MMKTEIEKNGHQKNHRGRVTAAVFFLVLVFSNALLTLLGIELLKGFHENRGLAPKPAFNNGNFKVAKFIDDFETYINDHFTFRKPLLISWNTLRYLLFNLSSNRAALPSKDGWIFYNISFMRNDYIRANKLDPGYVDKIEQSLQERKAWLKARGIGFIFLLAPNKHNIYPQYMHPLLKRGNGPSNGELLVQRLCKTVPHTVVDMFTPLHRAARHRQLFYKIDTHWNHQGGRLAAETIYQAIKKWFPTIKVKPLPEMIETLEVLSPGSFGRLMGVPLQEEERIPIPRGGWNWRNVSVSSWKKLLPERARVYQRINPKAPPIQVLVLGDSYMSRLDKYIAEMFGSAIFLNLWDTARKAINRFPIDFIESRKPDLVIFQMVERRLRYQRDDPPGYYYYAENPPQVRRCVDTLNEPQAAVIKKVNEK